MAKATARHIVKSKKIGTNHTFFAIIALLLPFVVLTLIELGLRQSDFHRKNQLFNQIQNRNYTWNIAQSSFASRYFGGFQPSVALNPFLVEPEPEIFRIFVLGGSTTAGYPYSFGYGFPQQLELMLGQERPDVRTEVINLGMTAVNSYTVWDISRRLHQFDPDLFVIYAGHNEYYGAYGAGSSASVPGFLSPALNRVVIRSLDLALVQWTRNLFRSKGNTEISATGSTESLATGSTLSHTDFANQSISSLRTLNPVQPRSERIRNVADSEIPTDRGLRTTTMQQMIRDSEIQLDGKTYLRGVRQFKSNLDQIALITRKHGIPVVLSTVSSNLKDQPPLSDNAEALQAFRVGQAEFARGDTLSARHQFELALEHDGLRFRAPTAINTTIREVAGRYAHITLTDIESAVHHVSASGIADASFFTDHLHPNAEGYRFMAETFLQSILPLMPEYSGNMRCDRFEKPHSPRRTALVPDTFEYHLSRLNLEILLSGYPFVKDVDSETHSQAGRRLLEEASSEASPAGLRLAARFLMNGGHPLTYYRELISATEIHLQRGAEIQSQSGTESPSATGHIEPHSPVQATETLREYLRTETAAAMWGPLDHSRFNAVLAKVMPLSPPFSELEPFLLLASARTGDPLYYNILAALYLQDGDMARACRFLEATETLIPSDPDVINNMILFHLSVGDTLKAREYYLKTIPASGR
jgi:lysophospholipase L1-like esterase